MRTVFLKKLHRALEKDLPYRYPRPSGGVPAAVLILIAQSEPGSNQFSILLTQRTEKVESHKGQVAFPGGVKDPEDDQAHGLLTTALRETHEEVGIPPSEIEVVGQIPELWVTTGFNVTPFVAVSKLSVLEIEKAGLLKVSVDEIDHIFWAELSRLALPEVYQEELMEYGAKRYPIDVFNLDRYRIWGATGAMLKNLLDRLHQTE